MPLVQTCPRWECVLVSASTERGAAITVEGLQRGAFDFIRKPDGPDEKANAVLLQQQLFEKIDLFAQRRTRLLRRHPAAQAAVAAADFTAPAGFTPSRSGHRRAARRPSPVCSRS